jgi:hypothetical protein
MLLLEGTYSSALQRTLRAIYTGTTARVVSFVSSLLLFKDAGMVNEMNQSTNPDIIMPPFAAGS